MGTNRKAPPLTLFDVTKAIGKTNIYPYLSPKELSLFAKTSRTARRETFFLRIQLTALYAEYAGLEYYSRGDLTRLVAVELLKKNPALLFEKGTGTVIDHVGREMKANTYRAFLGAFDPWAIKQVHDNIISKIEGGEAKAQAEFKKQFPNCPWPFDPKTLNEEALYDNRNKEQIVQVIAQLQKIVTEINADPCTKGRATLPGTKAAVEELREIFAPKKGEIIETGLHFPLGIMEEIGKVYDAHRNSWDHERLAFFSREVIGSAEAALTAVDGQACKYGLENLKKKEGGPVRWDGLFCHKPVGIPKEKAPLGNKLGHEMFVDPFNGFSCFSSSVPGRFDWYNKQEPLMKGDGISGVGSSWDGIWTTYGKQKLMAMGAILLPPPPEEKSTHHFYDRMLSMIRMPF